MVFQDGKTGIHSIADLVRLTGASTRKIRFYVREGLLEGPDQKGGVSAKYRETDLLRLKLIDRMMATHLKLAGIRETLEKLTEQDLRRMVGDVERTAPKREMWNKGALEDWLQGHPKRAIMNQMGVKDFKSGEPDARKGSESFRAMGWGEVSRQVAGKGPLSQSYGEGVASTWKRIEIADGLELNLRSDVEQKYSQLITELKDRLRGRKG